MSSIDFRTMPINVPSLCIPRVFPNIDERRIRNIFANLDMGEIGRIDIIQRSTEKGEKFNRVFVHFKRWNIGGNADIARERLLNGKDIKIIYDDPWFWKISAYREPVSRPPSNRPAPRLQFDDEDRQREDRQREEPRNQERQREKRPNRWSKKPDRSYEPRTPSTSPPEKNAELITNDCDGK